MKVNLVYFKRTGKYYSEGSFEQEADDDTGGKFSSYLFGIWATVKEMRDSGCLPGLSDTIRPEGHKEFIILVDVPEHPYNHPKLIL